MPAAGAKGRRRRRRQLLKQVAALAAAPLLAPVPLALARGSGRFLDYPFKLGVASGDPLADGFVLWTRLAPDPLRGGGMEPEAVPVVYEVAEDPGMRRLRRRGSLAARPELAHALHVDIEGLEPDREYFYRFIAGGEASPVGRALTFPPLGKARSRLRFAWASCQHFGQGYFNSYRHMLDEDLDLILYLGDYIYESTWGPRVRFHLPEPYDLEQYRNMHALYKTDRDLQAAHAICPWAVTWDDHEVDNDYANLQSEEGTPVEAFRKRRSAAYQAYYEHMPLRLSARPEGAAMRLYQTVTFGDLITFALLDDRQYRDDQACPLPKERGGRLIGDCPERTDENRTMLGQAQEQWLGEAVLGGPPTHWTAIAQQTLFSELRRLKEGREVWWSDGWDGYPAARRRIIEEIERRGLRNVIFLGGDIHQYWVADVKKDFRDMASPTVATEFVGTSITSASGPWAEPFLAGNPHVKFHDWSHRGYARAEVTPERLRVDFRAVETVTDPRAGVSTLASFAVEKGRPGAVRL